MLTIDLFFDDVLQKGRVSGGFGIHSGGGLLGCSAGEEVLDLFRHDAVACLLFVVIELGVPARNKGGSHEFGEVGDERCVGGFGGVRSIESVVCFGQKKHGKCIV